jgi:hypothetical protein
MTSVVISSSANGNTLLWSDEFDGTSLDPSKWTIYDQADGTDSWYRAANVAVSGGTLKVYSKEELYNGRHWTGGYIDTAPSGSAHPQYGYLEARVRVTPAGCYTWSTWWTVGWVNQTLVWPPEFDICEYQGNGALPPGKTPGQSYHWTTNAYDTASTGVDESQWHTYGVYWTATQAPQFYVDGVRSMLSTGLVSVAAKPMKLKLTSSPNIYTRFSGCTLGTMEVDYVRVYDFPPPPSSLPGQVSQGEPVNASSFQAGNDPKNGNDGSLSTRWAAADATYPQWWRVDLGSVQPITKAVISWYNSSSRAYKYRIEVSNDDTNYTVAVDNTGNTSFGDTTNSFSATSRFVRVTVTGTTASGGYASFYECQIYGAAPLAPVGLTAVGSTEQIALTWRASSGASSYNVKRAGSSGGPYTVIANASVTNYTDKGLAKTATYYYVVSGVNGAGEGTNSAEASATTWSEYQTWQMRYFGCMGCPQADPASDPDGDGMNNANEFLTGTVPTVAGAYPHIIAITLTNDTDIAISYLGANGDTNYPGGPMTCTNVLDFGTGDANGGYIGNFISTGLTNILSGGTGLGANITVIDAFGATNSPVRYYRVRVLAP